jgi:hypothetical protein
MSRVVFEAFTRRTLTGTRDVNGEQQLLWPDIIAAIGYVKSLYLPFPLYCEHVEIAAREFLYIEPTRIFTGARDEIPEAEAIYIATPVIVDNKSLFDEHWPLTKDQERKIIQSYCEKARAAGYRRIVTSLGMGDVSIAERLNDMGPGAKVVAFKEFEGFTDTVFQVEI